MFVDWKIDKPFFLWKHHLTSKNKSKTDYRALFLGWNVLITSVKNFPDASKFQWWLIMPALVELNANQHRFQKVRSERMPEGMWAYFLIHFCLNSQIFYKICSCDWFFCLKQSITKLFLYIQMHLSCCPYIRMYFCAASNGQIVLLTFLLFWQTLHQYPEILTTLIPKHEVHIHIVFQHRTHVLPVWSQVYGCNKRVNSSTDSISGNFFRF
jgi:hypothetical protein